MLSEAGKKWFVNLGSKEIMKLEYRQSFAFICTIGNTEVNEKRSTILEEPVNLTMIKERGNPYEKY